MCYTDHIDNKMKIIVTVRTLNESKNIERFCESYAWADQILIADGGSSDDTLLKASKFPNTYDYIFSDKVWHTDKVFSNPRGKHVNFLIDWAIRWEADWIVFDDVDCIPTVDMQQSIRNTMMYCSADMIFAYRMYVIGKDEYFPDANKPGQSLYAWRRDVKVRGDESNPTMFTMLIPDKSRLNLEHPYSLLHYFYPDEETMKQKMEFYSATGDASGIPQHPRNVFGRVEKLPEWATWKHG
jgi:glycosyltransferase involved in cell wall biosynthesis